MSRSAIPSLRKHRPSGRAVVTVRLSSGVRRDLYCGPWRSAEAEREYRRVCAVLMANGGLYPAAGSDLTIVEAVRDYIRHAERHYGPKAGELWTIKRALRTIRELYGREPAS